MDSPPILLLIGATFLLAGFVKGVIGGGLPTIGIGILGVVMPIPAAAALVVLPSFVTNIWQSSGPRFAALFKRIWLMLAGICLGAWLGAGLMTGAYSGWTRAGLGIALVIYCGLGLLKVRFHTPRHSEWWLAPPVGVVTGFIAAGTGVFVIPSGPYLQAIGFDKDDLIQALGITYTVSTIVLAGILAHATTMTASIIVPSLVALGGALAGMKAGQMFRTWIAEETFRTVFYAGLLLLGVYLTARELI